MRKAFDLQRYGTWRELQFQINTIGPDYGKLAIRSIRITFFMDTMKLQTVPTPPGEVFEPPIIIVGEFVVTGDPINPTEIVTGDDGQNVTVIP